MLVPLARSLWQLARFPESRAALAEAVELAQRLGDARSEIHARLWLRRVDWSIEPDVDVAELEREAQSAALRFEALSDRAVTSKHGSSRTLRRSTTAGSSRASRRSSVRSTTGVARHRGGPRGRRGDHAPCLGAAIVVGGSRPCAELLAQDDLGRTDKADVLDYMAPLLAIRGEFEAARASVRRAHLFWRKAGVLAPDTPDWLAEASIVELVAGD